MNSSMIVFSSMNAPGPDYGLPKIIAKTSISDDSEHSPERIRMHSAMRSIARIDKDAMLWRLALRGLLLLWRVGEHPLRMA